MAHFLDYMLEQGDDKEEWVTPITRILQLTQSQEPGEGYEVINLKGDSQEFADVMFLVIRKTKETTSASSTDTTEAHVTTTTGVYINPLAVGF